MRLYLCAKEMIMTVKNAMLTVSAVVVAAAVVAAVVVAAVVAAV